MSTVLHDPVHDIFRTGSAMSEREAFDISVDVAYMNCANMAPRLKSVSAAGRGALDAMAAPWSVVAEDWFAGTATLKALFAALIGARADSAALVPSVSYGIATAARNIPLCDGDNIVLVEREYPSNYYSWAKQAQQNGATIRTAAAAPGISITQAVLAAIDARTAVVSVPHCHWTDGSFVDVVRIGEAARKHGAALVIDASQSLGAYPLDVAQCRPDFLVSVGYKWLLGPYGLGYLYVDERWHGDGVPLEESWLHRAGSENFAALADYTDAYQPGAARFGQGESPQFCLQPMAIAALSQVSQWTPAHIQPRLREWTDALCERAGAIGFGFPDSAQRVGHMVGLRAPGQGLPAGLVEKLCGDGVHVAVRGDSIRVAPHLHNDEADLRRLVESLRKHTT